MTQPFTRRFVVRWSDVDANGHLRNTAYSDYASDTRVGLFSHLGFDWARLQSLHLGPVLFREELEYRREAAMGDEVVVDALAAGFAPDLSRWSIQHRIWRGDGTEMAQVTVTGAWLDREARKLTVLPHDLALALRGMQRASTFVELPPIRRK